MSIASEIVRIKNAKEDIKEQLDRWLSEPDGTKLENFISGLTPLFGDANGEWHGEQPTGSNAQYTLWDLINIIPDMTYALHVSGTTSMLQRATPHSIGAVTIKKKDGFGYFYDSAFRNLYNYNPNLKYIKSINIELSETTTTFNFREVFKGDSSLEEVPPIVITGPTGALALTDTYECFRDSAVKTVPALVGVTAINQLNRTFNKSGLVDASGVAAWFALTNTDSTGTNIFEDSTHLKYVPDLNASFKSGTSYLFRGCTNIEHIGNLNFPNVTSSSYMFWEIGKEAEQTTIGNIDMPNCSKFNDRFISAPNLVSLGYIYFGHLTTFAFSGYSLTRLTDFGGFKDFGKAFTTQSANSITLSLSDMKNLNRQSYVNVFNQVWDLASDGKAAQKISVAYNNTKTEITDSDIAIATNKGWTVVI